MLHHYLTLKHHSPSDVLSSAHWAVGKNKDCVLLQTDDGLEQSRIKLTDDEAIEVASSLLNAVRERVKLGHIENGK